MAYNKRTWVGRQGTGLNKFSINGASPVTVVNQPDSITEQGDALSAGNMNDLENRIYTAFEDEATARDDADTALKAAIAKNTAEIENLKQTTGQQEITVSYPDDGNYSSLMPNKVPLSVANYAEVPTIRGKSRAWSQLMKKTDFGVNGTFNDVTFTSDTAVGSLKINGTASAEIARDICSGIFKDETHKYLVFDPNRTQGLKVYNGYSANGVVDCGTGGFVGPKPAGAVWTSYVYIDVPSGTVFNNAESKIRIYDLTLLGIDSVTSVSEALALIPSLALDNAYDAGSLVDTVVSGVESRDTSDNVLDTLSLSTPVTLRSAGSVAEVLTLEAGKKTRPIGSYTFTGNDNWESYSDGFILVINDLKIVSDDNPPNINCAGYSTANIYSSSNMIIAQLNWDKYIFIRNSSFASVADCKTGMAGKTMNYELATPLSDEQVCDPIPDNFLEVEGGGTVETIQTQTPVIDNCLDVTYDIIPA